MFSGIVSSTVYFLQCLEECTNQNSELKDSSGICSAETVYQNIEVNDIAEFKNSDDSVKDKDYDPSSSDESSVDSNYNQQEIQSLENTETATNNNTTAVEEYKGRPEKRSMK